MINAVQICAYKLYRECIIFSIYNYKINYLHFLVNIFSFFIFLVSKALHDLSVLSHHSKNNYDQSTSGALLKTLF